MFRARIGREIHYPHTPTSVLQVQTPYAHVSTCIGTSIEYQHTPTLVLAPICRYTQPSKPTNLVALSFEVLLLRFSRRAGSSIPSLSTGHSVATA
eukprot:3121366-Rhodomonas_salina.2